MSERQSRFRFSRTTAIRWPAALLLGVLLAGPAWAAVSDFTLTDHLGKSHQLSWYSDQRLVVIAAFAAGDATSVEAARQLHSAQGAADAPDDVVFMLINARPADSRGSVETALTAAGLNLPVLMDETQLVTGNLGLSRHGEVVVLDPDTREVRHRGSAAGLPEALEALLAAQPVTASAAEGAAIEFSGQAAVAAQGVSYTDDIAPMLKANCVVCHTPGGIAPWAMTGHAMVRGWAPMMREVVLTRRMPPGQFDTHASLPMADAAGLSTLQQQQLLHWIDAGAPWDGKGADPLAEVQAADSRFTLGEPDLLFEVPAQAIPATGIIDYRYVPVNLNLDRDLWLRAVEFVPGDRQVLHHVIAYLASPADRTSRGRGDGSPQGESLAGFAPGRQPDQFGPEGGRFVPKGSNLLLQMHYTTSGRETVDKTQVGLYLHEAPPKYVMREAVAGQRRFLVPPREKEYPLQGDLEIERDAWLYNMTPHMHYRGRYMSYEAQYPDGRTQTVLSVPRYDFNWQFSYKLKEPLFLPAGTRLVARGAMDNSAQNPANPNPDVPVHFGLQTRHEMFFGFTMLRYDDEAPADVATTTAAAKRGSGGVAGGAP